MHTVFAIFKRDVKRLLRNPVAMIVVFGVCVLPSLYAWFNIIANWDPYKNTGDVAVAIVNEDQGADIPDMGPMNAGDMIVEQLKENDQLGWRFVDDAEAADGVRSGRYYAAIVIPSDFTSTLAGVLDGKADKAHIAYYVNEKMNAISPKVTDTGATEIENRIDSTFVQTVGKVVGEKIVDAATTARGTVVGGSRSVARDVRDVQKLLDGLSQNLDDASSTIGSSRDAIGAATSMLSGVGGDSSASAQSLRAALGSLNDTRAQARSLDQTLSSSLATGAGTISSISSQANRDIADLTGSIAVAQGKIDHALSTLRDANEDALSTLGRLKDARSAIASIPLATGVSASVRDDIVRRLDEQISVFQQLCDDQAAHIQNLQALSDSIKNDAAVAGDLSDAVNTAIQDSAQGITKIGSEFSSTTMPELDRALDSFTGVGSQLAATLEAVSPMIGQTTAQLEQLSTTLAQTQDVLGQTRTSLQSAKGDLGLLAGDLDAVASADIVHRLTTLMKIDPEHLGAYLGSPVKIVDEPIYPVANYGSGVAPFYTNLALWVGGFVLVAIYKLEVDQEGIGSFKPWQGYFGRWLLLNTLGMFQSLICCIGDIALGVQCVSPAAFILAGLVESFVYVNIIYALSIAFKHIGKALAVLLVVVQIPGSSGMYPIQMMPGFFRALNPWLPFTYGINAMREAVAGFYDSYYAFNIFMLLLYVVPSLVVGVGLRRYLLNINSLFDQKLGEADLMVTEREGMPEVNFRLSTIIKALGNSEQYRKVFSERVANFELRYPIYIKRGFLTLFIVPIVLMILMFVLPYRMVTITAWIVSLIAVCTYLIVVEYLHSRVSQKTRIANMTSEELYQLLDDKLKQELFAFAPIESLKLNRSIGTRRRDFMRGVGDADDTEGDSVIVPHRSILQLPLQHAGSLVEKGQALLRQAQKDDEPSSAEAPAPEKPIKIEAEQTITMHLPSSDRKGGDGRA